MLSKIHSAGLSGLEGYHVSVEVDEGDGLPRSVIVGNVSPSVREALERCQVALKNSSVFLPPKRLTINLAPADRRKDGTFFDLAILSGVLKAIYMPAGADTDQYGFIGSGDIELYKGYDKCEYQFTDKNPELLSRDLNGYENYMLKEIEETPAVLTRLVDNYFDGKNFLFDKELVSVIRKAKEVVFIACGTSYHASLQGVRYMHYLNKRSEAYIASEWAYYPVFGNKNAVYVLISQSGETADLIRCQKIINSRGLVNVAITNTKGSTIDREATFSCLLYAGLEVAVASTKAFSAQVSLLALLVGAIEGHDNVIYHLQVVKEAMYEIITRKKELEDIASEVEKANMLFFIGRGNDLDGVKEAALKMKEISYIHSEAFPGGELKHGPIAIVDKDTSTIAFISEVSTELAIRANVKEIEARGAKSFVFAAKGLYKDGDAFAVPMCKNYLAILPMVYCGQYLSYYVALHKGVNIDKPRNLAKSVTVE